MKKMMTRNRSSHLEVAEYFFPSLSQILSISFTILYLHCFPCPLPPSLPRMLSVSASVSLYVCGGVSRSSYCMSISISISLASFSLSHLSLTLSFSLSLSRGFRTQLHAYAQMISFSFSYYSSLSGWSFHVVCRSNVFLLVFLVFIHHRRSRKTHPRYCTEAEQCRFFACAGMWVLPRH